MDKSRPQHYVEVVRDMERLVNNIKQLPLDLLKQILKDLEDRIGLLKKDLMSNNIICANTVKEKILEVDNFDAVSVEGDLSSEIKIVMEENGKIMKIGLFDNFSSLENDKTEESYRAVSDENIIIQKLEDFFECQHCSSNFVTKTSLDQHLISSHPTAQESPIFFCFNCDKKFLSEVGLYLHVKNKHSDGREDVLSCEEDDCEYTTTSRQLLRVHRLSHATNSVMKCPICSKEYLGGAKAFKNHMKLHTGEKNYVCDICDKSFVSQSRLTYHKANVHEPPKYQCENCSKMFRSKVSFDRHILVHSNDPATSRPFQCEYCEYKARTSGNLTSHVKSIHNITDFTAGKKLKEIKKEKVSRKILSRTKFKNVENSDDLKKALGDKVAEDYISSIPPHKEITLNKLKQNESEKRSSQESNIPVDSREKSLRRSRREREEEEETQILTMSTEKAGVINLIRLDRAQLETVETDGVVFDETKLVQDYEMSDSLGQEVHVESGNSTKLKMSNANPKIGQKVEAVGKDCTGTIAYIGTTQFAGGKWIGLVLDDPKGKNNGTVEGKRYFSCPENYGMFCRQSQIKVLSDSPGRSSKTPSRENSALTPRQKSDLGRGPARQKSDLSTPAREKSDASDLESVNEESKETPSLGSKLATSRSRLPLPGSGRQPSFTQITRKAETPKSATSSQQPFQRERSFVETNFVQTPKTSNITQILPEPISTPTSASKAAPGGTAGAGGLSQVILSDKVEEKINNIQLQQEITNYREDLKDLQEKLDTLKVKRSQDKEKLKDYERIMIQNEQLVEFKTRIMEAQSQLQRDLQKAKHEAKVAIEAKDNHAEEMSELSETVEMATLDKEMAEERAETLQIELDACKERIEELQLDLEIIKAEMGEGARAEVAANSGGGGGAAVGVTNFELKTLQAQNEKLRETLVSMRDLSAHEKHQLSKIAKDLEEKVSELGIKTKENEKLTVQVDELEATISDLQEQVDAALGAEEMVENLTTKCLDLEDRIVAVLEEKSDLEALHDINEQLQENAREVELELREEIDMHQAKIRELQRDKDATDEVIIDHEATINKFRLFVQQIQDQNRDLKTALEKETSKPVSGTMGVSHEMLDFKKMFAETKAHAKAIDVELRKSEIEEAGTHVKYLMAFMGETFTARGGDYEAIQVLLIIPRLIRKSLILLGQVKDHFPVADTIDLTSVVKGHSVDRFIFGTRLTHLLNSLLVSLDKFHQAMARCSVESLLRVGTLQPEMSVHERGLDFYIDLLHKGQLDENVPVTNLEKTVSYFETVFPIHLSEARTDCPSFLSGHVKVYLAGVDNLTVEIKRARVLLDKAGEASAVGLLLKSMENQCKDLDTQVKIIRRRLPQDGSQGPITFSESVASNMTAAALSIHLVIKVLANFGKNLMQMATANPDQAVPAPKVQEALHSAVDTVTEFGDQGIDFCVNSLSSALAKLSVISASVQSGEFDFDGSREELPVHPIFTRADQVKSEIKDTSQLKYKLEAKEIDIKDLKKLLKIKQEELSEMQIRKDLLEKKLSDSSKDSEMMIEKLNRKLEDAQILLKRKEKEFEETMDHLQADIESLENERGEMKEKMKAMSKKALIEGLSKSVSLSPGPTSLGPSVPSPVRDSPLLVQQLQDMRSAMTTLQGSLARKEVEQLSKRLSVLPPIKLPAKTVGPSAMGEKQDRSKEAGPDVGQLMARCNKARQELYSLMAGHGVVDITRNNGGGSNSGPSIKDINMRKLKESELRKEVEQLQVEILKLMTSRKPGYKAESSFGTFASRDYAKILNNKNLTLFGKVDLSGSIKPADKDGIPVVTTARGALEIHNKILL